MTVVAMDFNMPTEIACALVALALQPVFLLATSRVSRLKERAPVQFAISSALTTILWLAALIFFKPSDTVDAMRALLGLMALISGMLLYLEIWGLMSRGYTLGILLTLLEANQPLTRDEIATRYRGSDGIDWIMRHRMSGLVAAGMVELRDSRIILMPGGLFIARLYRIAILFLGLRSSG